MSNKAALENINAEVVQCDQCPRLINHITKVSEEKVRRFKDWEYWGKPVPGFGDFNAELLIIGLAPAAHGANRTGRMFTGDQSGDWLYRGLYEAGFANQPESYSVNDGMTLHNTYITAVCRCAPPQNKPTKAEINTCSYNYLQREIAAMPQLKTVLCLGRVAFDTYKRLKSLKGVNFGHGAFYSFDEQPALMASYHPSRQNTNTGKLKWKDWVAIFHSIREFLNSENS